MRGRERESCVCYFNNSAICMDAGEVRATYFVHVHGMTDTKDLRIYGFLLAHPNQ